MNTKQRHALRKAKEVCNELLRSGDAQAAALAVHTEALISEAFTDPAAPVTDGFRLISVSTLAQWKSAVNDTAALSLKAERYRVGAALKQRIADAIAASPQPPAQPVVSMRPEAAIKLQAAELIERAVALGIVVTIERRALKPLAMGYAEYRIETRPARVAS